MVTFLSDTARGPRPRAFFLGLALLALSAAVPAGAAAVHEGLRPWAFRFQPCQDAKVAGLVGRAVDDAVKQARAMRLMAMRVLDRWTAVNLEVVPERLTMVVHDNGVVVRAFCR